MDARHRFLDPRQAGPRIHLGLPGARQAVRSLSRRHTNAELPLIDANSISDPRQSASSRPTGVVGWVLASLAVAGRRPFSPPPCHPETSPPRLTLVTVGARSPV